MTEMLSPVHILLIEDNLGDIELTREALRISKIANRLTVVQNGRSALDMLEAAEKEDQLPDLVLLDLNLPGISGSEVLSRIKGTPGWARIPIVILTSSQAEADIVKSYELHANCYVTKPLDFSQFIHVVRSIEDFWFTLVRLPRRDA